MSTANNRLEIVGFGTNSVTFRLIQTDRDYDPTSMRGNKGIVGRKSTRSDDTDLSKLERIDVYFNDVASKEPEKRRVLFAKKSGSRVDAAGKLTEDANIQFGEFNKKDLNCWTNLNLGTVSEVGSLIDTSASEAVVHSYPSIFHTRLGSGGAGGSELFGSAASAADSPLVKFLQGDNMADGVYELKQKGGGAETVMFRVTGGAATPHGVAGVDVDNKEELKANTRYVVTKVVCTYGTHIKS